MNFPPHLEAVFPALRLTQSCYMNNCFFRKLVVQSLIGSPSFFYKYNVPEYEINGISEISQLSSELRKICKCNLQSLTKYLRLALVFTWHSALQGKFSFYFKSFLLGLRKASLGQEDCTLGYHSMKFRHFPDIS